MRTRLTALLGTMVLAAGLATVAPAQAGTGGTVDRDNTYDDVGLILFYDGTGRYRCSATLVSPTVLLTAAHCTDGTVGRTLVDFEPIIAEEPPTPYDQAADPEAGYTPEEIEEMGYLAGTASTHPDYSGFTDLDNWNDAGVIVLDEPVEGIEPRAIADEGTLDAIPRRLLRKTIFRAVGYGTEVRKPEAGPQKPQPMTFPLVRRYVDLPGQKLTDQILQANGNEHDNAGTGGTCFGDSGGPLLLDGEIVGVTSYGYTASCRYIDGYQRVDIPAVREWLATVGVD